MRIQRGSICWFEQAPVVGHEQAKRRPWVVISRPGLLQQGLVTLCPITSEPTASRNPALTAWVVPFELDDVIGDGLGRGWVLAHHLRTCSVNRFYGEWVDARLSAEVVARVADAAGDSIGLSQT